MNETEKTQEQFKTVNDFLDKIGEWKENLFRYGDAADVDQIPPVVRQAMSGILSLQLTVLNKLEGVDKKLIQLMSSDIITGVKYVYCAGYRDGGNGGRPLPDAAGKNSKLGEKPASEKIETSDA